MAKKKTPGWLIGCGLGCGILVLLGVIGTSVGGLWVFRLFDTFDGAIATRGELEERFGTPEAFVPPSDGAIRADRMETFLAVRESLQPYCDRFQGTFGAFQRMEEIDERGEPSMREALGVVRSALGIAPLLGRFSAARNQELLDAGMGMGEYTYIYVLAYRSWLDKPAEDEGGPLTSRRLSGRVRNALAEMLRRQRERLAEEQTEGHQELIDMLEAEIAALEEDRDRVPWQDGLPEHLEAALAPHRERLESLYCPAAQDFELARNRRRGITIQTD